MPDKKTIWPDVDTVKKRMVTIRYELLEMLDKKIYDDSKLSVMDAANPLYRAKITDLYMQTNYFKACAAIYSVKEETADLDDKAYIDYLKPLRDEDGTPIRGIVNDDLTESMEQRVVLYYFITHDDVSPFLNSGLSDENYSDLLSIWYRYNAFIDSIMFPHRNKRFFPIRLNDIELLTKFIQYEHEISTEKAAEIAGAVTQETQQLSKEIPHLFSIIPARHIMPNNKLINTMTMEQNIVNAGEFELQISDVKTTFMLTYGEEENKVEQILKRLPFTEYDRNVYNAVTSIYVYGVQPYCFTPATVYRAMVGLTDNEKPTENQLKAVTKSIDKMRFIRIRMNRTAELKKRRAILDGVPVDDRIDDTYLLPAKGIELRAGKNVVDGYCLIDSPILYEYAAAVGQVLTVPIEMLDVKKLDKKGNPSTHSLEYTEQRILIKGYLIRRIEGMKGKNSLKNPSIRFLDYEKNGETHKGLYSIVRSNENTENDTTTAGADNPTKEDARCIRNDVKAMLDYWKAAEYIKGYTPYKEGRIIAGYTIEV